MEKGWMEVIRQQLELFYFIQTCFFAAWRRLCLEGVGAVNSEMPIGSLYALLCCSLKAPKDGQTPDTPTNTHSEDERETYCTVHTSLPLSASVLVPLFLSFPSLSPFTVS